MRQLARIGIAAVLVTATPVMAGTLDEYWAALPNVDDPTLKAVLQDAETYWYNAETLTPAYQDWEGALKGVHAIAYNVSADPREPFGNANREFPWSTPGGTHLAANVESLKFLHLPKRQDGSRWPVAVYRRPGRPEYAWVYPVGATLGEVLFIRHEGRLYCFELRTRTREPDDWAVDIFRPYPTLESLVEALSQLGEQQLAVQTSLSPVQQEILASRHPRQVFHATARRQYLPDYPSHVVARLLTDVTFTSALGREWSDQADGATTTASFHVVPHNYTGAHLGNDRNGCINCHQDTQLSARAIQPSRDWYGLVRGSDGIFTWHPFAESSISWDGSSLPVHLRGEFLSQGLAAWYDLRQHPPSVYSVSRFSQ